MMVVEQCAPRRRPDGDEVETAIKALSEALPDPPRQTLTAELERGRAHALCVAPHKGGIATANMATSAKPTLRRSVTPWGSFSWGYSDVGADIFVGAGLGVRRRRRRLERRLPVRRPRVRLHRPGVHGAGRDVSGRRRRPVFRHARPGRYLRFHRRLGGTARLHDRHHALRLGLRRLSRPADPAAQLDHASVVHFIAVLAADRRSLPCSTSIGVRESTTFNGIVSALDVISETSILFFGFLFAFEPELLVHSMQIGLADAVSTDERHLARDHLVRRPRIDLAGRARNAAPGFDHPAHLDLADPDDSDLRARVLESGARHATLAPDPAGADGTSAVLRISWAPTKTTIKRSRSCRPTFRYFGALAALYVPVLGAILLLISSNSGVFGSSRIAYAMSQSRLLPTIFERVHPALPHAGRLDRRLLVRRRSSS